MTCHSIIYVSEAIVSLDERALLQLHAQARIQHQRAALTGVLLYHEGQFLQVMEGPEKMLREFYNRIAHDPRHWKLQKLADGPKAQRDFSGWYMSFARHASAAPLPNYLTLPELVATVEPTPMRSLLHEFLAESTCRCARGA